MVTNVSASQTVATVVAVEGQAFARSPSGQMRPLRVGDTVREGDTIITLADGEVQLDLVNGQSIALPPNDSFQFTLQAQPVATVIAVEGEVFARGADGQMRPLKVGDVVLEGDTIITMVDGNVQLQTLEGQLLSFLPNEAFKFSAETTPITSPDPAEAVLPAGEAGRIIQALQTGGNIDDEIESTETGLDSGSLHDETGSVVWLFRIVENTNDLAFELPPAEPGIPGTDNLNPNPSDDGVNAPPPASPSAPSAPTISLDTDSGSSNSDGITNAGTFSVGATEAGATVEYSTDG
ncbi:MAG: retention module-containing protein, partial [Pseudomonadota bacterium]